jgi:TRAP-type mannitol/chloroaromatic compound transport system permease small subunit
MMTLLLRLSRLIDATTQLAAHLAVALVLVCIVITFGNAVARYFFETSSETWREVQWTMFGGIILLGVSHILKLNGRVRVNVLYARFSLRTRAWLDIAGLMIFLIPLSALMMAHSWPVLQEALLMRQGQTTLAEGIRLAVQLLLSLGFLLLLLQGISEVIKRLDGLLNPSDHEPSLS